MNERKLRKLLQVEGATTTELFCTVHVLRADHIAVIFSSHPQSEVLGGWQPYSHGVVARAALAGESCLVDDVSLFPDYLSVYHGIASEFAIPMVSGSEVSAVVNFESTEKYFFSKHRTRFLELTSRIGDYFQFQGAASQSRFLLVSEPLLIRVGSEDRLKLEVSAISDRLLKDLAGNPLLVHQLGFRKFEEVVGRILEDLGYAVTLTPIQKDGGFDLFAETQLETGTVLTLVECKKWSPENPVNISVVRNVLGTLSVREATNAMIVTTSCFTRDARREADVARYKLSLRDYQDLRLWLARYDVIT